MRRPLITALATLCLAAPAAAQQPEGIRLGGPYNTQRAILAVRPFNGEGEPVDSITRIIQRDLTHSSRFNVLQALPSHLHAGDIDYAAWNTLNVIYLVAGEAVAVPGGLEIHIAAHDVVYGRVVNQGRFRVPPADDVDFRMAVHAVSDEVVRWITGTPGAAATRIALSRQNGSGSYDLLVVDSDGFNVRRIAGFGGQLYSPTWSPDGRRVLYAVNAEERGWQLIERDITSGSQRTITPGPTDLIQTPAYAPDGSRIAIAMWRNSRLELAEYDIAQQCCLTRLTGQARVDELSPAYAPDGRRMAFVSTRIGRPAIYVMNRDGGSVTRVSPYVQGQASEYQSPSWSPTSNRIVFHGHWNMRAGNYQIMIADADRPGAPVEQITARGTNEDPSWAPDGRHVVYTSEGDGPPGLYIIDSETKDRRPLIQGGGLRMAEWSPVLLRAAELAAQN